MKERLRRGKAKGKGERHMRGYLSVPKSTAGKKEESWRLRRSERANLSLTIADSSESRKKCVRRNSKRGE